MPKISKKQFILAGLVFLLIIAIALAVFFLFQSLPKKEETLPKVTISSKKWIQVNGPYGGWITDLEKSGQNLVAGTSYTYSLGGNGLYRFGQNSLNWELLGGTDEPVSDITVDPRNEDKILFVADGLYLTDDGGVNWRKIDLGGGDYRSVAISLANPSLIFAGTDVGGKAGIFVSSDGGKNWARVSYLPDTEWSVRSIWAGIEEEAKSSINVIAPHPKNENTLFVGTNSALFKSSDKGKSWKRIDATFHRTDILGIAINPKRVNEIYVRVGVFEEKKCMAIAGSESKSRPSEEKEKCAGVYKSTDTGETWQQTDAYYFDPSEGGVFSDEYNPNNVYAIFSRLIQKTSDGGKTWDKFFWTHDDKNILNVGLERLVVGKNSNEIFIAGRQGLLHTDDAGEHWHDRNKGFIGSEVVDIVKAKDGTIYAGTYSLGMFRSNDNGQNWEFSSYNLENPYVMLLAAHPTNPKTVFLTTNGGVYVSSDNGKNWQTVAPNFFFGKKGVLPDIAHFHGIFFDPKNPKRIYVGGGGDQYSPEGAGISISDDGGKTWVESNTGFETDVHVSKIVVDEKNPAVIYATTQGATEFQNKTGSGFGIFKSTDYGKNWEKINNGLETVEINTITIDPNNSSILFVGTDDNGVYKSKDGGKTWKKLHIPKAPKSFGVGDIEIDPKNSNRIFVATVDYFRLFQSRGLVGDHGVFMSEDGGETWQDFNEGLRHKGAFSLEIDEETDVIYVGTRGGGVYWRKLSE